MTFKPSTHLSKESAEKLSHLLETVKSRPLEYSEYRWVKDEIEYYTQVKFWMKHIGKEGYEEYRNMKWRGRRGKYDGYVTIWKIQHSPLAKALE